jgi:hypothetical protein
MEALQLLFTIYEKDSEFNMINYRLILTFLSLVLGIIGCQGNTQQNQSNSKCPPESKVALAKNNVEDIILNATDTSKSVMAGINRPIAYSFMGKKGHKLNYKTSDNLCVWLYSPEIKLLNDNMLPQDGKYFLQVSPPEGSGTFELKISLTGNDSSPDPKVAASTSPSSVASSPSTNSDRLSPDRAMINHYQAINNGNLDEAWSDLTTQFKGAGLIKGKREFDEWWNSVKSTNVDSVKIISSSEDRAVVKIDLVYTLKQGRVFRDPRNKLKLVWDENSKKWLIDGKYQ